MSADKDTWGDIVTIADRIKEKRKELDLSQTDLAKRAGYSDRTTVSKIEHMGDDITMKQVKRIAEALNVPSAYLMGWCTEDGEIIYEANRSDAEIRQRASLMYEHYLSSNPAVQLAVETLLGLHQQDS